MSPKCILFDKNCHLEGQSVFLILILILLLLLFSNIYTGYFTYLHKIHKNIHQQNKLLLSVYDLCVKTLKDNKNKVIFKNQRLKIKMTVQFK